ncbi:hypothetical protein J6590_048165 [Homalodisca vitripennis]|nr:hypothetical protein J6590_048165 [Homalodisca vitripennis]
MSSSITLQHPEVYTRDAMSRRGVCLSVRGVSSLFRATSPVLLKGGSIGHYPLDSPILEIFSDYDVPVGTDYAILAKGLYCLIGLI